MVLSIQEKNKARKDMKYKVGVGLTITSVVREIPHPQCDLEPRLEAAT